MKVRALTQVFLALLLAVAGSTPLAAATATEAQVKQLLIQESINRYPGTCPCPYNTTRSGRRCGGRSAYSRPGGYSPLCFPSDVTKAMIETYRKEHGVGAP